MFRCVRKPNGGVAGSVDALDGARNSNSCAVSQTCAASDVTVLSTRSGSCRRVSPLRLGATRLDRTASTTWRLAGEQACPVRRPLALALRLLNRHDLTLRLLHQPELQVAVHQLALRMGP